MESCEEYWLMIVIMRETVPIMTINRMFMFFLQTKYLIENGGMAVHSLSPWYIALQQTECSRNVFRVFLYWASSCHWQTYLSSTSVCSSPVSVTLGWYNYNLVKTILRCFKLCLYGIRDQQYCPTYNSVISRQNCEKLKEKLRLVCNLVKSGI